MKTRLITLAVLVIFLVGAAPHVLAEDKTILGVTFPGEKVIEGKTLKLNGVAYRILKDKEMSHEVLQEAFLQIWHNANQYNRLKSQPFTWMTSIVRYRAYDRIKFELRRIEGAQIKAENEEFESLPAKRPLDIETMDIAASVHLRLSNLNKQQKESILMAYYYGYSREEIAEHFQTSPNNVKSWLRRGLAKLQQRAHH